MLTQAKLGDRIPYKERTWTVVRIVQSSSLHTGSEPHVIMENYLELHNEEGDVDFYVLSSEKLPYTGETALGLPPLPWKKEKQ